MITNKTGFLFLIALMLGLIHLKSQAQTYTYLPGNSGCDQSWTNGNCWEKVNIPNCNKNSPSAYPPLVDSGNLPGFNDPQFKNNCEVNVIINEDLVLDPGFDFSFYAPDYHITMGEGITLSITKSLYLNPASQLSLSNIQPYGEKANIFINGDINYNKQSTLNILDGVELEATDIKNAFGNSYEGTSINVAPEAILRGSGALNFTEGNSNIMTVEGIMDVRNVHLDAGDPGYGDSDLPTKNQLIIRGSGVSNVCSGIHAEGDSYVLVEEGGVLNLPSLSLAGQAIFDNKATANLQDIALSGDPYFRMFDGSETTYQNYTNSSAGTKVFKCGTEVNHPSDGVGGCNASFVQESGESYWESFTGDWCFRLLPVQYLFEHIRLDERSGKVILEWATAKEWENSHFEVELALDQTLDFHKIGVVKGVGWSNEVNNYYFEDNPPSIYGEERVYYRVKQVNFDGTYSYGKTLSVNIQPLEGANQLWKVFPNPVKDNQIAVARSENSNSINGPVTFRLINTFSTYWEFTMDSFSGQGEIWLNVSPGIPSGLSILEISHGDTKQFLKVVKK